MKILFVIFAFLCTSLAHAEAPSPASTREISHLLSYLESSNCQFQRNGSWYSAAQAKEHLNSKYSYLLDKGKITDAESFIRLAATESSMSGKPYKLKCKDGVEQESAIWLSAELTRFRKDTK